MPSLLPIALLLLLAAPALAQETAPPDPPALSVPVVPDAKPVAEQAPAFAPPSSPPEETYEPVGPLECMAPTMPGMLVGAGSKAPVDAFTAGANSIGGYLTDWQIYLGCIARRTARQFDDMCQAFMDKANAKAQQIQNNMQQQDNKSN